MEAKMQQFDVKTFLTTVAAGKTVSKYRNNQTAFSQGDLADAVFYIQNGTVKVTVMSKQGKEAVLAILGKGDFFGEGCLAGQARRQATVTAMTESAITRFDKATILRVLRDEPAFSELFTSYLLARNARIEEDRVDQFFNSSEKRLARLLLLMAKFGKGEEPEPVIAKINQETLAAMVGTTRSRVNAFMNTFRQLGFIEYSSSSLKINSSLLSIVLNEQSTVKHPALHARRRFYLWLSALLHPEAWSGFGEILQFV